MSLPDPPPPPSTALPPPGPPEERAPKRAWVIVSIGLLVAVVLYTGGLALSRSYGPALFAIPFFLGLVVGVLSPRRPFRNAAIVLALALALAVVLLQEGVVCLLYSLPLLIPELAIGTACGHVIRRWARTRRRQAQVIIGAVLVALGWQAIEGRLDDPARHPLHVAETSAVIAAGPERVFAALTARELRVPGRWPWFVRLGLPMPRALRFDPPGPGGKLRIELASGTAHGHVTVWQPPARLAFAIDRYEIADPPFHVTRLGRGPHYGLRAERVEDWLTLGELRYALERRPDGTTRLTRTTTWRRHLGPGFYFGWLQQTVIERGQRRLIDLVRQRIESGADVTDDGTSETLVSRR